MEYILPSLGIVITLICVLSIPLLFWLSDVINEITKIDKFARRHNKKSVPKVREGYLPFVGHGPAFSKDNIGFLRQAYKKYGPVFQLKIFRKNIVVICDHSLKAEYFKQTEDQMSLYESLRDLYFGDAFTDKKESLKTMFFLMKRTIKINFDTFSHKIMDEANKLVLKLKEKSGNEVNLTQETIRFVSHTSARCFIGIQMNDEFYKILMEMTQFLNKVIVWTYYVPKFILRLYANPILKGYRVKLNSLLDSEINSYRLDNLKNESNLIRTCVDYKDANGNSLNNSEIGDIIICLLYISSENTALGLAATLTDLINQPEYWDRVRLETKPLLQNGDIKTLFNTPFLDACVTESARMNTHVFPISRKPMNKLMSIGDYYLYNIDSVHLCEPIMMLYEGSPNNFPLQYNPDRFLGDNAESKSPNDIMTWGAGVHLCPGKQFSIYEIKAAVALIVNHLDPPRVLYQGPLDYFSPAAFAERKMTIVFKENAEELISQDNSLPITFKGKTYKITLVPGEDGHGGWLIKNCFDRDEQKQYYDHTIELSKDSVEHQEILTEANPNRAYPITYYNLVYTGKSNCQEPVKWFQWAKDIWTMMKENKELLNFPDVEIESFNSFYGQLFGKDSTMAVHKDQYVSWGVSISFGATTEFLFGKDKILLNSGDVFIADFSKVDHAVLKILDGTYPGWWDQENDPDNPDNASKTFNRARCSIQIRDISKCQPEKKMEMEEFKNLVKSS